MMFREKNEENISFQMRPTAPFYDLYIIMIKSNKKPSMYPINYILHTADYSTNKNGH